MVGTWHGHGHGMESVNQTAALCKSNGKDTFQTLTGTAWQGHVISAAGARHVHGMLCVNRHLKIYIGRGKGKVHPRTGHEAP
jgi:hypothetical protein